MSTQEKILSDFDAGHITLGEAVSRIARLITAENVAAIMAAIPAGFSHELLRWAGEWSSDDRVVLNSNLTDKEAKEITRRLQIASQAVGEWRARISGGMAKKQLAEPETLRRFFEFAIKLWHDGSRLKSIRTELGLSKKAFARESDISVQKLNEYERAGQMAGNFWLFCSHLEQVVIRDPDSWENYLEDPDDCMRGGTRGKREKRYGKPDKFWRWAEDAKKDEMSRRTGKEIPRGDVERWYKEWEKLGQPDGWGRQQSKPMQ